MSEFGGFPSQQKTPEGDPGAETVAARGGGMLARPHPAAGRGRPRCPVPSVATSIAPQINPSRQPGSRLPPPCSRGDAP